MAQARALGAAEMERVLEHVNAGRHAHRNRCFILLTHLAGLRVGEVASLRWLDVMNADGQIKEEVRLLPEMTASTQEPCSSAHGYVKSFSNMRTFTDVQHR